MPVEYYEWGALQGGSGGSPVVTVTFSAGAPEVFSGTATVAAATLTFTRTTTQVTVINVDDTGIMEYSLDSGATWIPLQPYGHRSHDVGAADIQVRRVGAADADYRVVATLSAP